MSWVCLIHLRPLEGESKPAFRQYPEAEFEFSIVSINPDRGAPDVDAIDKGEDWGHRTEPKFLTPADLEYQFHGVRDAQAISIAEAAIRAIEDGDMSPDVDFRSRWIELFDGTVAHYRAGLHEVH